MRSESTVVPPVTALRSPADSRITGADSPVIADSSTVANLLDAITIAGDDLTGLDDDLVTDSQALAGDLLLGPIGEQPSGHRVDPRLPQGGCLFLAAALGNGLGKIVEDKGRPEPDRHRDRERAGVEERQDGREHRPDPDGEDHRLTDEVARVEFDQGLGAQGWEEGQAGEEHDAAQEQDSAGSTSGG